MGHESGMSYTVSGEKACVSAASVNGCDGLQNRVPRFNSGRGLHSNPGNRSPDAPCAPVQPETPVQESGQPFVASPGGPVALRQLTKAARGRFVTIDGVDYPLSFSLRGMVGGYGRSIHHVYVMSAGSRDLQRAKIGQSNDAWRRREDIEMCSPLAVSLARVWKVPRFAAGWLERHAHDMLDDRRLHGEWFRCAACTAVRAVQSAIEFLPLLTDFWEERINTQPEWRAAVRDFRATLVLPPPDPPIP